MGRLFAALIALAVVGCAACGSQDSELQQHQEKFESLGASTSGIAEAWLGGDVSGTYAHTAFEQVYLLVEQQRTQLAADPRMLADSRGAHLSQAAEHLSRLLAVMIHDVDQRDPSSLRQHLTQIPILPQQQP